MNKKSIGFTTYPSVTRTHIPTRIRAPPLIVSTLTAAQRHQREKTFTSATTVIGRALEAMYLDMVDVSHSSMEDVIETVECFIHAIKYRVNKNRHNLKFGEPFIGGKTRIGIITQKSFRDLDLYIPLQFKDIRPKNAITGYAWIFMSRNPSYDRYQSVRCDDNKNLVSSLKVSKAVHEILTHICQSIGKGRTLPFDSNNSDFGEGTHQIVVLLDSLRLTFIPCLSPKVAKRDEDGTIYVTKPYIFDQDPASDKLWRFDNPSRTKCMQDAMDKADRGTRSKALRLINACHEVDPILQLCPREFVGMAVYGMFDVDIDQLPGWQTVKLETCFMNILRSWLQHMESNQLLHPFQRTVNVLQNMPENSRQQVKNRLTRLLSNQRELLRLLEVRQIP